jgi:uncharacterized protein (DUF1330 family)
MSAYLIATMAVHDPATYEGYKATVPALIEKHGGRYLVRGGERIDAETGWPDGRIVMLEFPDWGSANAFVDDPDYDPVKAIRHASAASHIWLVEGTDDGAAPPAAGAYLLAEVTMTDPDGYGPYAERVPGVLADAGGRYLARGGRTLSAEGGVALDRMVIVGFADISAARAFHGGAAYAPLKDIRRAASDSHVVIVAGM